MDRILSSRTFHGLLANRGNDGQDCRERKEVEESITEDNHTADYETAVIEIKHESEESDLIGYDGCSADTTCFKEEEDIFKQELFSQSNVSPWGESITEIHHKPEETDLEYEDESSVVTSYMVKDEVLSNKRVS